MKRLSSNKACIIALYVVELCAVGLSVCVLTLTDWAYEFEHGTDGILQVFVILCILLALCMQYEASKYDWDEEDEE